MGRSPVYARRNLFMLRAMLHCDKANLRTDSAAIGCPDLKAARATYARSGVNFLHGPSCFTPWESTSSQRAAFGRFVSNDTAYFLVATKLRKSATFQLETLACGRIDPF